MLRETFLKELTEKSFSRINELRREISEVCNDPFSAIIPVISDVEVSLTFMNKTFEKLRTKWEDVIRKNA